MPVYLLHGFRWPREGGLTNIRVWTIMHNLEDCSVDYIQNANSTHDILTSFRTDFPDLMAQLEGPGGRGLSFIEQYDPDDLNSEHALCQPYAYIADRVVVIAARQKVSDTNGMMVGDEGSSKGKGKGKEKEKAGQENTKAVGVREPRTLSHIVSREKPDRPSSKDLSNVLSVNIEEVIAQGPGFTPQAWEALADLRDKIAPESKIGWFCVYNGDPERGFDRDEEDEDEVEYYDGAELADMPGEETRPDATTGRTYQSFASRRAAAAARARPLSSGEKEVSFSGPPPQSQSTNTTSRASPRDRDMPPPPTIPVQEKGKRVSGLTATSTKETMLSPSQPSKSQQTKPDSLRKKFFGKR